MNWLREFAAHRAFMRFVRRRTERRSVQLIRRRSDDTLWAASCPQNFKFIASAMFGKGRQFHFVRARAWRGVLVVAPRVIWLPESGRLFAVLQLSRKVDGRWLPRWPEPKESALLARMEEQ